MHMGDKSDTQRLLDLLERLHVSTAIGNNFN